MKGIKALIFTMIGILTIGAVVCALVYFYTDTFKTNQEIFYKYISEEQASKIVDVSEMEQIVTKTKTTNSEQNLSLLINSSSDEGTFIENGNLKINNKIDVSNKKFESKIIFGDSEGEEVLEATIARNKNVYGLTIKDVLNQYIVLENNKINEFAKKLGITDAKIPNKIDIDGELNKATNEYIENANKVTQVSKELYNALKNGTDKTDYSKLAKTTITVDGVETEVTGYELNVKGNKLKAILSNVESLSDLGLIDQILDDSQLSIKIYLENRQVIKAEILFSENDGKLKLEKTLNTLTINIETEETGPMSVTIIKSGDVNTNQVAYTIYAETNNDEINVSAEIKAEVKFDVNFEIIDMTSENSTVINEISQENLAKIFQIIAERISKKEGIEDTLIGKFANALNNSIIDNAKKASNTIKVAQIGEAVALAKADIIMEIRTDSISLDDINAENFVKRINVYLDDELQDEMTIVTENNPNGVVEMKNKKIYIYLDRIEGLTLKDDESKTIQINLSELAS